MIKGLDILFKIGGFSILKMIIGGAVAVNSTIYSVKKMPFFASWDETRLRYVVNQQKRGQGKGKDTLGLP